MAGRLKSQGVSEVLIPVHKLPYPGACKAKGRSLAVVVAHAIVDDDCAHLAEYFWTLSKDGYAVTGMGGRRIFMHHAVIGCRRPGDVSHENTNRLDNQRENLRHCTRSENMLNPADGPNAANRSSGIRGVTRDDKGRHLSKPWRGKVTVKGKTYQTVRFATAEEAAAALDELRRKLRVREFPTVAHATGKHVFQATVRGGLT